MFRSAGLLPVFPLPNVVFFPRTVLPLHVFEARYRDMVRDAMNGEGLLAVSLLLPGWEASYEDSPAFHPIGTVGRIQDLTSLPDGRFNLKLAGVGRVHLGEVVRARPYRLVRAELLPELGVNEADPTVADAKRSLLACHGCLLRELIADGGAGVVLDERIPFEDAVNCACANLPVAPELRQALLQEGALLARHRRAASLIDEVLERILRAKTGQPTCDVN